MKINNEWLLLGVNAAVYLSCALLAISIVLMGIDYLNYGKVPVRLTIIALTSLIIVLLFIFFSGGDYISITIDLAIYVFMLSSMLIGLGGVRVLLNHLLNEPTNMSTLQGSFLVVFGFGFMWVLKKIQTLKSIENA